MGREPKGMYLSAVSGHIKEIPRLTVEKAEPLRDSALADELKNGSEQKNLKKLSHRTGLCSDQDIPIAARFFSGVPQPPPPWRPLSGSFVFSADGESKAAESKGCDLVLGTKKLTKSCDTS
jgi:hypothetical protein